MEKEMSAKIRRFFSGLLTGLLVMSTLLCIYLMFSMVNTGQASLFGCRAYYILTGSMEPTIPTKSLVISRKVDCGSLQVGDVITFEGKNPEIAGMPNTHRIVDSFLDSQGRRGFITKGDANTIADSQPVYESDILGKMVFHTGALSFLHKPLSFLGSSAGFFLAVMVPVMVLAALSMRDMVNAWRESMEEQRRELEAHRAVQPGGPVEVVTLDIPFVIVETEETEPCGAEAETEEQRSEQDENGAETRNGAEEAVVQP